MTKEIIRFRKKGYKIDVAVIDGKVAKVVGFTTAKAMRKKRDK